MFRVQKKACSTCIYRKDSVLDIQRLEAEIRDPHVGFTTFRTCHHSNDACCNGFWIRHKDEFQAGQMAQRFQIVEFVDDDTLDRFKKTGKKP